MPQQVPITLSGFEDRSLSVELPSLVTNGRLLVDGQVAPAAKQRGAYSLKRKNGKEVIVKLKTTFPDPLPKLIVDGKVVRIGPPIPWYAWIWSAIPLIFVLGGGFIGGALGGITATLNIQLFRAPWTMPKRFLATAGLSLAAFVLCSIIVRFMNPDIIPMTSLPISTPHSKPLSAPKPAR